MKILVVDDDKELLEVLTETLTLLIKEPKEIISINDSSKAIKIIEKEKLDVILTDFNMPFFNGKDIIDMGLKQNVKKIFLMSGENPNIEKYQGKVIFYPKPIFLGNLIENIEKEI